MTPFLPARKPANESARLRSVDRTGLMDSVQLDRFDIYTDLMRRLSGFPVAYCGLIDDARQYFLSHNFPDCLAGPEVPRQNTLCQFALLQPTPYIVPDMRLHERLSSHPLVTGAPHLISWAAFPLVTVEGHVLGTLCAVDYTPRDLTEDQIGAMRAVAAELALVIEAHIELREGAARRSAQMLGQLAAQPGLERTETAARFLRMCEGIPGSADDVTQLAASGLVERGPNGNATLSALGRNLQSRLGLAPSGFIARRTVLNSDDLMSDLLGLVGA